jgi:diguanylate cyclase (GGDEF)-like protein/PAS domain S-box-containing protein
LSTDERYPAEGRDAEQPVAGVVPGDVPQAGSGAAADTGDASKEPAGAVEDAPGRPGDAKKWPGNATTRSGSPADRRSNGVDQPGNAAGRAEGPMNEAGHPINEPPRPMNEADRPTNRPVDPTDAARRNPDLGVLREAESASAALHDAAAGRNGRTPRVWSSITTGPEPVATTFEDADRKPPPGRAMVIYVVATVALAIAYLLIPAMLVPAWALTVVCSITAFVVGTVRNRPRRRIWWFCLAAGYLTFAFGTVIALSKPPEDFPSVADLVFLGVELPFLLVGLIGLTRSGASNLDRVGMIDAGILTAGAGFLAWTFLINPFLQNPDLNPLEKAVSIAYPITDVLTLALLTRLGLTAARSRSLTLLIVSGAALLGADTLYGLTRLNGDWQLGGPIDLGWLIFYIAGGAAALHPSMIRLTEPHVLTRSQVSLRRGLLTVASLLAPTALLIQALRGPVTDGVVIAGVSAGLIILALARMSVVANSLRQTLGRERQLRLACEELLVSGSTAEVTDVLRRAVGQMLPPGTPHRVAFDLRVADPAAATTSAPEPPATQSVGLVEVQYVRTLPEALAFELSGFELALRCRLAVGSEQVGDLVVAAEELALVGLQDSLPILAGQAATMIDRINLSHEISRRDSQAYFRTLVLNATEVIAIVDDEDLFTYVSPAAEHVFGTAELSGGKLLDVIDPSQRDEVRRALGATRAGRPVEGLNLWLVRRVDGEPVYTEATIGDMRGEPGVRGLVITLRDVSERRRLEQELIARAYVDPLTGLGNRLQFQDDVAVAAVDHDGVCGVMIINIDDFRVVNDTMGHEVGDELLIAVAKRLSAVIAGHGTVARLGADEFGAVIDDAADIAHIEHLAEQVIATSTEPFHVGGSLATAHLRVGVATSADAESAKELLGQADVALDSAKSSTTTRWRRYEASLHAEVIDQMQMRTDLDRALTENEFLLNYQPIVDLGSTRTVGFEALLRWPHPGRGMVSPVVFIPVAEESGLIVPLGAWVLRTAVVAAAAWQRLNPVAAPYVSVNVSVRQFRMPDFVDQVFDELAKAGLPPHQLTVEITESLLLGDDDQIRADIARLREAGIKVSIDDFGTGYSSLSYLHRVPVDTLKLDKSFVDTITASSQQLDLVRGIIQLAGTLSLEVVAEGVETAEEHRLLTEAGCALGQGYLFARPLPEEDARLRIAVEATHE